MVEVILEISEFIDCSDINSDGVVNIFDLIMLIDMILDN